MLHWMLTKENGGPEGDHLVAVTVGHKVYCFEGYSSRDDMDRLNVHVFNTVSSRWKKLPPVTPGRDGRRLEVLPNRGQYTAVLIQDVIYIWGGFPHSNLLHAFDVDDHRWFLPNVSGTVPEERWGHSACAFGNVMFIYGGYNDLTGYFNDIYKLDTTSMVWSFINARGTPPPASYWHSATIIGTKMYVFGGRGNGGYYNTINVFDTETNCWLRTPPSAQLSKGCCGLPALAYNGELYILEDNMDKDCNDLWKFNPETLCWKKVEPKGKGPAQIRFKFHCMVGDRVFLFGGHKVDTWNTPIHKLYVLDLSPSLKTLCKLAVIQYGLEQSGLPHNIRWELVAMTTNSNR